MTKAERAELSGYVSTAARATRVFLFLLSVAAVITISTFALRLLALPAIVSLLPAGIVGLLLYARAKRWTGGRDFRDGVRQDLDRNLALVHRVRVRAAIIFEEREDEGPIIFVQTDTGDTLVFTGQDLARSVQRGFPWSEFEVREAPASRQFFRLKPLDARFNGSAVRPPLSADLYKELGLARIRRWGRVTIAFDRLADVA